MSRCEQESESELVLSCANLGEIIFCSIPLLRSSNPNPSHNPGQNRLAQRRFSLPTPLLSLILFYHARHRCKFTSKYFSLARSVAYLCVALFFMFVACAFVSSLGNSTHAYAYAPSALFTSHSCAALDTACILIYTIETLNRQSIVGPNRHRYQLSLQLLTTPPRGSSFALVCSHFLLNQVLSLRATNRSLQTSSNLSSAYSSYRKLNNTTQRAGPLPYIHPLTDCAPCSRLHVRLRFPLPTSPQEKLNCCPSDSLRSPYQPPCVLVTSSLRARASLAANMRKHMRQRDARYPDGAVPTGHCGNQLSLARSRRRVVSTIYLHAKQAPRNERDLLRAAAFMYQVTCVQ